MNALETRDVVKTFGELRAVDGVSMGVAPGEVVGLVGANGAGKTTLIRLLLGLIAPDRGTVRLAGGAPSRTTRRRVGYVPQGLGLWDDLTLTEHLALVDDVYGGASRDIPDGRLADAARVPVGRLPLGLRRRAAFTVALAHAPDVLLLDEPTSGVDPLARSRLWETMRRAAEDGAAVLVSTHYLDEASRCDRVVLLAGGRVVAQGDVAEVVSGRRTVALSTDRWREAWTRLEDAGLDVVPAGRELRVVGAGLDEVRAALDRLDAELQDAPATLEEVFLQASRP